MTIEAPLADVQNQLDGRGVALDRVGVTGLYFPLTIREKSGGHQAITARVDLMVGLHEDQRGAHLSSLVEALQVYEERLFSMDDLIALVLDIRARQDARGLAFDRAEVRVRFKYFVSKAAPASGVTSLVAYDCGFDVEVGENGAKSIVVGVPVTSVCPCSLEISDIGAHNQRAEVTVQLWQPLDDGRFIWLEDLIALVERCGSGPVHSVLKRADEKLVTEQMFRAPRFVEDIVRGVVVRLRSEIGQIRYRARCESFESIHAHNAVAEVSGAC
jgi:GTP cyclohydrolase IB